LDLGEKGVYPSYTRDLRQKILTLANVSLFHIIL